MCRPSLRKYPRTSTTMDVSPCPHVHCWKFHISITVDISSSRRVFTKFNLLSIVSMAEFLGFHFSGPWSLRQSLTYFLHLDRSHLAKQTSTFSGQTILASNISELHRLMSRFHAWLLLLLLLHSGARLNEAKSGLWSKKGSLRGARTY